MPIYLNTAIKTNILTVTRGDSATVLPTWLRPINETVPFTGGGSERGDVTPITPFTEVMIDKRAPGVFTTAYAGPTAKLEWLAELMVTNGCVAEVARELMRHDLIHDINERTLRANAKFKSGVVVMTYPQLYKTMLSITGASDARADKRRIVARVLTELLAKVYSEFGVMMPYKSFYHQEYYPDVVANTASLIRNSHVATVTETLEVMKLGSKMSAKEFSAAVVESVMGPTLINAAQKLLAAERYNRWMNDAAILTGQFLRNADTPELDALRDDGNLMVLATNASWGLDAIDMSIRKAVLSPVHEHAEILQHAVLRLRELRRYEHMSLERFKSMYSTSLTKTAKGRLAGVFITRNVSLALTSKAAVLHEDSSIIMPSSAYMLDPYVPMLNEMANNAFSGDVTVGVARVTTQYAMIRRMEEDDQATAIGMCVTEEEVKYLALAMAGKVMVASSPLYPSATLYFGCQDGRVNYEARGYYQGDYVYTTDPAEVLILAGDDHVGTGAFPTRPQTFDDNLFDGLLDEVNPELFNPATKALAIQLPVEGVEDFNTTVSLYSLVTGETEAPLFSHYMSVDRVAQAYVSSMFGLALVTYNELKGRGNRVDDAMAEQVITTLHDVISRYAKSATFARFLRTLQAYMIARGTLTVRDARRTLQSAATKHALAVRLAGALLVRTGVIAYGLQDDIMRALADVDAVERAATSQAFSNVLSGSAKY